MDKAILTLVVLLFVSMAVFFAILYYEHALYESFIHEMRVRINNSMCDFDDVLVDYQETLRQFQEVPQVAQQDGGVPESVGSVVEDIPTIQQLFNIS